MLSYKFSVFILLVLNKCCYCAEAAKPMNRIVGGTIATINDFPYLASIRLDGKHHCGGAIINQKTVLTAAHCIASILETDTSGWQIHAGATVSSEPGQEHNILWVVAHEDYNVNGTRHDIAVMRIVGSFEYDDNVQNIRIYPKEDVPVGTNATISGWGATAAGEDAEARGLQTAEVPIISNTDCAEAYKEAGEIYDTNLCAGYKEGGIDACQGDSGGPLVLNGLLIGVVSWGIGCASSEYPGVYTKAYPYIKWIQSASDVKLTADPTGGPAIKN